MAEVTRRKESKSSLEACTININPNYTFMPLLRQCPWGKDFGASYFAILLSSVRAIWFLLVCGCSVAKLNAAYFDPMDCSMSVSFVFHHLSGFAQIQVHWVSDAIYPSYRLLPLPPFAFTLSQHLGLSHWVSSSIRWPKHWSLRLASVLTMDIQGWFPLGLTDVISLQSKGLSKESSLVQFESINSSMLNLLYCPTLT